MNNSSPYLFIFGSRSSAIEIAETTETLNLGWNIALVSEEAPRTIGHQHIIDHQLPAFAEKLPGKHRFILSMANQELRSQYLELATSVQLEAQTIIHPQATLSPSASVGPGSYLAPGSRVSAQARIGDHSILNLNVTFGHDTKSGCHLIVNPGAAIGGNVTIGARVLVGSNAFIQQGIQVGDDCQIDAMTYAGQSLEPNTLCTSRQFRTFPRRNI